MNMILHSIFLIIGFVLLIKGADVFVEGASSIAGNFKMSKILIGLTIVAFGTSAPEFAVSIKSLASGNYDVILGNVIGSNILNILLIIGVSSLFKSVSIKEGTFKREIPMMLLLLLVFSVLLMDNYFNKDYLNSFSVSDSIIILIIFGIFIFYLIKLSMKKYHDDNNLEIMSLPKSFIYTIMGIVLIYIGSNLVVDNASLLAKTIGVSEKMVSLTIVALGTSLPELVTSVTASKKGEVDLAIGNVVGSNIFNIGVVFAIPALIFGGIECVNINIIDLSVMLLSGILLWIFAKSERKIDKKEGIIFLIVFVVYYIYVIANK